MLTIKFFASLKQKLGKSQIDVELSAPKTVAEIIAKLENELPSIKQALNDTKAMIAVNHEFSDENTILKDGDELAFIPPMSGGSNSFVRIQESDFSVEEEVNRIKKRSHNIGGIVIFLGTAREMSRNQIVKELNFEHYPIMAEKKLNEIREQALSKYNIIEVIIVHRTGRIEIGENIVLIVVAAEHRQDAFAACQWCIDELKQITPIWKKEVAESGDIWVEEHP